MKIGESFTNMGVHEVYINIFLEPKEVPVGQALVSSMSLPRRGFSSFMAIHKPNIPVKPATMISSKVEPANKRQGLLLWRSVQAGVVAGVHEAVENRIISEKELESHCIIAALWIKQEAGDDEAIYQSNKDAAFLALKRSIEGYPGSDKFNEVAQSPINPFYTPSRI